MQTATVWLFACIEWPAVAAGDSRRPGTWFLPVCVTGLILTTAFMFCRIYLER
jgi:hypothetical protein